MHIRKAKAQDILGIAAVYDAVLDAEEREANVGWIRGVYPTQATVEASLARGDLFVLEENGRILGAAILNQTQVDVYAQGAWQFAAAPEEVCVLHTLAIRPDAGRCGLGSAFVAFYEDYARRLGCRVLRMDTNAINRRARALYHKLGYREAGIVPTTFNGIPGVDLVLLEKAL